ncbi:MAG TPA: hypothetical protein VFH59_07750 [Frateuria sp.]|uniref:hypothetical protein n=1 Tax=Frateuria sp. TaxID=2211372 RepID=UPI002D7FA3FD|nr:hypothetical protein [Frateuria sp.]HET6805315.1 hypothetical protein [Frateuria sp.]
MNFQPRSWFGRKSNDIGSSALVRAGMAMGPWTGQINGFVPRQVNPWFYEALREALGILDGAINRLVTVDGILGVEGANDKLVQEIERDLFGAIPVGDLQGGLQAFYAGQGNEMYEQGFTVGEMVLDRKGREVIGLRVADSKGVLFNRNIESGLLETWYLPPLPNVHGRRDGTDAVETVMRNTARQQAASVLQGKGYALLDPGTLIYSAFNPENDQPYGVSLLRSIEFVGQILLKMHNATGQVWDRFGDPVFHVNYKTKNRQASSDTTLEKRRKALADTLQGALNAKRSGNSADFVTAVGADDEIAISIIGGDGKVLNIEMPARHMLEQILAKTGQPAWMLGMQFSTAERMADNQAEVVLQESKTRFEARKPGLTRLVETWLRGRGRTWRPGDWQIVQRLPNLRDELKRAQAGFLNAQTQMMLANGGNAPPPGAVDPPRDNTGPANPSGAPGKAAALELSLEGLSPLVTAAVSKALQQRNACTHHKGATGAPVESWAVDDPNLPRIEGEAVSTLRSAWNKLRDDTLAALTLPAKTAKSTGELLFAFDAEALLTRLQGLLDAFIAANSNPQSAFVAQVFEAWLRGVENAASSVDRTAEAAQVVAEARDRATTGIHEREAPQFRETATRTYWDQIVAELKQGAYDGKNPLEVAAGLRKRFGDKAYDWERLARSEIALAQARGQRDGFKGLGYAWYGIDTAPDACPVCISLKEVGPYKIDDGPLPMEDTHPNCRCGVEPADPPAEAV